MRHCLVALCLPAFLGACDPTCTLAPVIVGEPVIAGEPNVAFDRVEWTAEHKQDVDAEEDGCISRLDFVFSQAGSCALTMSAAPDGDGGFRVFAMSLTADSTCSGFADDIEDTYALAPDSEPVFVTGPPLDVPDENASFSCVESEASFEGTATLLPQRNQDGPTLTIDLSGVSARGGLGSRGNELAGCSAR